jgi:hypothetical protein
MQVIEKGDPMLVRLGVATAIRSTFQAATGVDDADAALEWAVNLGWLVVGDDRETLTLTPQGEQIVWRWWKAYMEGRERSQGRIVLPGDGS